MLQLAPPVFATVTVRLAVVPEHIVVPLFIDAVGRLFTVIVVEDEFTDAQTPLCTTALYAVVLVRLL